MVHINNFILILICLFLTACSGTRYLADGEKLYVGAEIKLKSSDNINHRAIVNMTEEALRPQINTSYLGMRPKLIMYNAAGENPTSKFKKWLKKNGEAPVLMRTIKPGITSSIIDARLFNNGIFESYTESENLERKRTGKVVYTCHVHQPFLIQELIYDIRDDSLSRLILAEKDNSLIQPGQAYDLELLKNERIRIDTQLKNNGYFYFNPDYLLFKADTSGSSHTVSFTLTLKDSIPSNALKVYHINKVLINQNYSLNERSSRNASDSVIYENTVFIGSEARMKVKPSEILRSVYLREGEIFSRLNHTTTLNRLMSMGNFKLVQVNFSATKDSVPGLLDVTILMTPLSKYSFSAEMDMVSKSNNYTGPRMNLSVLNRNTFKGGELLKLNLAGTYEAQLGGSEENLYSYSFNPQVELSFPRFIVPFNFAKSNERYVPKTSFLLSYNYLKKVNYFDIRTFNFMYGYRWKENVKIEHQLNPIDVSFSSIRHKSDEFNALLETNPFLKKSYEEQFIAGGSYSYTYSEQMLSGKRAQTFIQFKSDVAGNALSLAKFIGGNTISSETPNTVAGSVYSQFAKLSLDSRMFYNFRAKNKLVLRVFAGAAKPYGNSSVLPYTQQFFCGGPNSIRAFQINSVGPGNYFQDVNTQGFLQMGGDVKLEMNAEYRFNIFSYFDGAFFVDAGNVWLLKSNPSLVGTPFSLTGFHDQIAVGTGLGLRIDVSFFVLRFDLATPLRKPWYEENEHWVVNQMDFRNSAWRKENLVLNVAIGYPF
ncbi:MAG: BamA/TamA family outer membrane protein [Prolixibacteraceae bacterium]